MPMQNFIVGEMLNKRTPNTKTWMNFDGSYKTEIHSGIVHFDDGLNNLHNINTSLFDEADADTYEGPTSRHGKNMLKHEKEKVKDKKKKGKMNRDDFDYQVPTLPFSCQIPKNIKKGYSIGQNDDFVRFIPQNVSPSKGYVNKAKNNEIQYQDAWNDTDIILEVTDRGIKETMILKTDRAPFSFSFEVDGVIEDDLTMGNMKLEPAWLIDAVGEKRDVAQTIRREGDVTYIDLVADVEGLVYPIKIDPTVTVKEEGGVNVQDTYGNSGSSFNNNNYSVSSRLYVGHNTGNYYSSFFKFPLDSIPAGAHVQSASLYMVVQQAVNSPNVLVKRVLNSWDETTLTWNNQPSLSNESISHTGVSGGNTIHIGSIVQSMLDNEDHGFAIVNDPTNGTSLAKTLEIYSSESGVIASSLPRLTVAYNEPPTAPTVITPNGGETWNSSHTVEWLGALDNDEIRQNISDTEATGSIGFSSGQEAGQTFKVVNSGKIKSVSIFVTTSSVFGITLTIKDVVGGKGGSVVYATKNIPASSVQAGKMTFVLDTPLDVSAGQMLAFSFVNTAGSTIGYKYANIPTYYNDGNAYWSNTVQSSDIRVEVVISESASLQYQIQLSTDNGTNWLDIVTLTSAGATQYIHDFINAPQTSTAKIRIRAYDGSAYGPWDESDGVFSIIHNEAPSAPTNLTPVTTKDRAEVIRFAWQHNDPNADAQSKFDLDYRPQGSTTWNNVTQNTVNQFYDLPAGTLPRGTIEWSVRTYDQADLSGPYSELKTFLAGDKPSKPTTLNPKEGSIVSVSNPTVEWSSVGQVGYNLKVLDATETEVLWETNQTSNNKAHTVGYSLENETDYVIQLTIRNVDGISSDIEKSHIHVSYTPPAVPIITSSKEESALVIGITNPIPSGTEPKVSFNSIFRREIGNVKFIRIATDLPDDSIFTDYTVASGQDYEYQVRAFGDNGTFRDSLINTYAVSFENVRLNLASQPNLQVELKFNGERSFDTSFQSSQSQFAGRKRPVTEFGIMVNNNMDLNYVIDPIEIEKLREILYKRETLLYRDSRGRKFYVTAGNFSVSDDMEFDYYEVALPLSEVDYTEEV